MKSKGLCGELGNIPLEGNVIQEIGVGLQKLLIHENSETPERVQRNCRNSPRHFSSIGTCAQDEKRHERKKMSGLIFPEYSQN